MTSADIDHGPSCSNETQYDHPDHSRCTEDGGESHAPGYPAHDSGSDPEEWVKVAEQRASMESMEQATMDGHE
jgi:hypothetical protein